MNNYSRENPEFTTERPGYTFDGANGEQYHPQINGLEYNAPDLQVQEIAAQAVLAREAAEPGKSRPEAVELSQTEAALLVSHLGAQIAGYRQEELGLAA